MVHFFSQFARANGQTRSPRFAGSWYSAQPVELNEQLNQYLKQAKLQLPAQPQAKAEQPLAIIVPHAGYMFSGQTAAFAYAALSAYKFKRVFLFGPSHYIPFSGAALPGESIFETPLGNLEIDKAVVQRLLQLPYFQQIQAVFEGEHSLEMQLPWIYKTLGKVKLVPLAIGSINPEKIRLLTSAIKKELKDGDLIIVSSDFTHYGPRFDYQPFSGATDVQASIKALDMQAFNCLNKIDSLAILEFYQRTGDTICGIYPCALLLSLLPPNTESKLLNYRTSEDAQKDLDGNSVSYMAILFSCPKGKTWSSGEAKTIPSAAQETSAPLTQADGNVLLKIARQALEDYLAGAKKNPEQYANLLSKDQASRFMQGRGVFVTLYEKSNNAQDNKSKAKQLRGCIGYIYPDKPLLQAVCENAINAASADPRFNPVKPDELPNLSLEINVLTKPVSIPGWQDIKLGQDGIVLRKSGHQAVFLPKVATEFGWDLPQTLSQLAIKAGLLPFDWQKDAQFEIFQGQSFSDFPSN